MPIPCALALVDLYTVPVPGASPFLGREAGAGGLVASVALPFLLTFTAVWAVALSMAALRISRDIPIAHRLVAGLPTPASVAHAALQG